MTEFQHFTFNELLSKYPFTKLWNWTPNKLGVFYSCLLLDGRKFNGKRIMVTEESFLDLIKFTEDSVQYPTENDQFIAYEEVFEEFRTARSYRWTNTSIGILCSAKLLQNKWSKLERCNLVNRSTVQRLLHYTNDRFQTIINCPID